MSRHLGLLARTLATALVALGVPVVLGAAPAQAATTLLVVSTTADTAGGSNPCANPGVTTPPSTLSLRDATCVANNVGGQVTISIPRGPLT